MAPTLKLSHQNHSRPPDIAMAPLSAYHLVTLLGLLEMGIPETVKMKEQVSMKKEQVLAVVLGLAAYQNLGAHSAHSLGI